MKNHVSLGELEYLVTKQMGFKLLAPTKIKMNPDPDF